eukprot:m.339355 g.339355  ORF g.339355 m.339355 type:complete len:395 (+) comp20582_c0_seq2:79-1263(+)
MTLPASTIECCKCDAETSCSLPKHQIDEIQALEAIFTTDFTFVSSCPRVRVSVSLRVSEDVSFGGDRCGDRLSPRVSIEFCLPTTYPEVDVPEIYVAGGIQDVSTGSESITAQGIYLELEAHLKKCASSEFRGSEALFQLVEEARSFLQDCHARFRSSRSQQRNLQTSEDEDRQQQGPNESCGKIPHDVVKSAIISRSSRPTDSAGFVSVLHIDHMNAPKIYTKNLLSIAHNCWLWLAQIRRGHKCESQNTDQNPGCIVSDISPELSTHSSRLENIRCVVYSNETVFIERFMKALRSEKMDLNKRKQPCQERKASVLTPLTACYKKEPTENLIAGFVRGTTVHSKHSLENRTAGRRLFGLTEMGDPHHPEKLIAESDFDKWLAGAFEMIGTSIS